jgi:predicted adenylyl cyclase CyaB
VEALSDAPVEILDQEDTFFTTPQGRMKLRVLGTNSGQLISYRREDVPGPRPSRYLIAPTGDPTALKEILTSVCGVLGVVRKRRCLYRIGQTRIHLDRVSGLGDFIELEVVLRPDQAESEGMQIAAQLMERLGIAADQLVEKAYLDLVNGP